MFELNRLRVRLVTLFPSKRNFRRAREVEIVNSSGLFDRDAYDQVSGASAAGWKPAEHYVWIGEKLDLRPSKIFDPRFYREQSPDVAATGANMFAHYICWGRGEGRLSSADLRRNKPVEAEESVLSKASENSSASVEFRNRELIKASGLFDVAVYRRQCPELSAEIDEIDHYMKVGEKMNLLPSFKFDPEFYGAHNPDVSSSGRNLLVHYINHGLAEGRLNVPFRDLIKSLDESLNQNRSTVVLLVHEASQTGAPILGLNIAKLLKYSCNYNVVVISRRKGVLAEAFKTDVDVYVEPSGEANLSVAEIAYLAKICRYRINPRYLVANSAVCFDVAVAMEKAGLPVVALIHEFSSLFGSKVVLKEYFKIISALVFPAQIVKSASVEDYPELLDRLTYVLPQGRSTVPNAASSHESGGKLSRSESAPAVLKWARWSDSVTVVGLGTVEWRKGVDVFVSTAVSYFSRFPREKCRFVWVGAQNAHSHEIAIYLHEQLARSQITDCVLFLPETSNLEDVYENVDILFVSSRLDPLPNVAIDAMLKGIPVVSFSGATGISDLLSPVPGLGRLVVPYLNSDAAASAIYELVSDEKLYKDTSAAIKIFADRAFDMKSYVIALDEIGRTAANKKAVLRI